MRAKLAADGDTVAVGQPDVEHGDIRTQGRDSYQRLGRGRRLAHDDDVVLGLEQLLDAAPDHLVVVEQEDANGLSGLGHGLHGNGLGVVAKACSRSSSRARGSAAQPMRASACSP